LVPNASPGGRTRRAASRELVNAILYMLRGGQAWRLLPHDFPLWQTVYYYLRRWQAEGVWERVHHTVLVADRERAGREASPAAAIIDSRPVRTADQKGGCRGYDPGKKIPGRKRHILTDTDGRLLAVQVHAASVQDRDGAKPLLRASRRLRCFVQTASLMAATPESWWTGRSSRCTWCSPSSSGHMRCHALSRCTPLGGGAQLRLVDREPPPGP
jgi:putative transposase